MKIKNLIFLIFILTPLFLNLSNLVLTPAQAQTYNFSQNSGLEKTGKKAGYKTTNDNNIEKYISQIITVVLSLVGVVFLGFTIYAGITWMIATGNQEKVNKAKEILIESIIGIIIVIAAYAISYFVLKATTDSLIQ